MLFEKWIIMASIENILLKSEEKIRSLFNGIPTPTFVWQFIDNEFILIDFNRAADDYTQGNIKNYLGVKASEFYQHRQDILDDLNTCLKNKKNIFKEMEYTFRSGEKKLIDVKYSHISPDIVVVYTDDISERKRIEHKLKKSVHDQKERIKELLCLYSISDLALRPYITEDELIQGTLELIPPSMQFPEFTSAEIKYGDKLFRTNNFKETPWNLPSGLIINEIDLSINIYYLEDNPFLDEESHLINEIIQRLEIILGRKKVEDDLKKLNLELESKIEKRTEELKESEEMYRSLFDHSMVGCSIVKDNQIIDANQALLDIFNYNSFEDFANKSIFNHVAPESREIVMERFKKMQKGIYVDPNIVLKFLRKDGKIINVETNYSDILIRNERYTQTIFRDITESKQKEDKIRLNSEIMTNIAEGVYLIRLEDGIIVYANSRFEEMFGYDQGEMNGKDVSIVNAPADKTPEETREIILEILADKGEWHGEVKNIKKDGTHFWCYANVSLYEHPVYGTVSISVHTDITER
ncbi:hypothetical protein LCGC14_1905820, partial [marine sediment metagenome]